MFDIFGRLGQREDFGKMSNKMIIIFDEPESGFARNDEGALDMRSRFKISIFKKI